VFFPHHLTLYILGLENDLEPAPGHLVSVFMLFNVQVAGPAGCGSKLVMKRLKLTIFEAIALKDISHTDVIAVFLVVHVLSEQYSPGVHSAPTFKLQ
jgi:hypothetical protein